MTKEQVLFSLLRSEIVGEKPTFDDSVTMELLEEVMQLARAHSIAHLAADGLLKSGLSLDDHFRSSCEHTVLFEIANDARRTYALKMTQDAFEENHIDYIPLKGSVIRHLYPETWMRNSCDIDILVRREDLDRAVAALTHDAGYTVCHKGGHDIALMFGETRLELHFNLIEEGRAKQATDILADVWSYARPMGEGYEYALSDDLFYFYHIAHMAKHITNGGCGIRYFLDVWLLNQKERDVDKAKALLDRGGLLTIAGLIEHLVDVWFGDDQHTELTRELEKFVIGSGTYGAFENRVLLTKINMGGKASYFLPRLFLPFRLMKVKYPVVARVPILLPFLWIYRIVGMLFSKSAREKAKKEIHNVSKVDDSNMDSLQQLMDTLEL